ncbi:MAG: hypothetical protein Q4F99_02395 [bacterium]|nr:hypothetical protein [bacterium]
METEKACTSLAMCILHKIGLGFTWVTTILAAPVLGILYLIYSPIALLFLIVSLCCKKCIGPCVWLRQLGESPALKHPIVMTLRWIVFILWRLILSVIGLLLWIVIASAIWAMCVFISSIGLKILVYATFIACIAIVVVKFLPFAKDTPVLSSIKKISVYKTTLVAGLMGWLILWLILLNTTFTNVGPLVKCIALPVASSMNCDVTIETLDICPLEGRVSIQKLRVENPRAFIESKPDAYKETPLVKLDDFTVHVDLPSLFKDGAFSTSDIQIKNFTLKGLRVLIAWDTLKGTPEGGKEEEFVVTNIDALMIQMGLKQLPTPEVLEAEAEAAALAEAEAEQLEADKIAKIESKEAALDQQLEALEAETDKAIAEGKMTRSEANEKITLEKKKIREALEAYKAEWETKVTIQKLRIEDNSITLYWGHSFLPIDPRIPIAFPPLEMDNVSSEYLREKYEPIIDSIIEAYDIFDGFRRNICGGIADVYEGLKNLGSEALESAGETLSTSYETVSDSVGSAANVATDTLANAWDNLRQIVSDETTSEEEKKEEVKDLGKSLKEEGKKIKEQLKSDSKGALEDAKNAFEGFKSLF